MLVSWFINAFLRTFNFVVGFIDIPTQYNSTIVGMLSHTYQMLQIAGDFFPLSLLLIIIGNIVMWMFVHLALSAIRFVLDFIPFM